MDVHGDEPSIHQGAAEGLGTDLVDEMQRELELRLAELRPVVEEYQRLSRAAEKLGGIANEDDGSIEAPAPPTELSRSRLRAMPGATRMAILEALDEGPRTAAELQKLTGMSRTNIGYNLRRLLLRGVIAASERGSETTYRLASPNHLRAL